MKVLVTPTSFNPARAGSALEILRSFSEDLVFNPTERPLSEDELIPLLSGCKGYIAGLDSVTRKVIENAPDLKVISRYGVGIDKVDIRAAKERGIIVCNTPGTNSNAAADLTFGLLLSVARKLTLLDRTTKEGQWLRSTGFELCGKTLGIIGLGSVGKAVAKRASGFSMKILASDYFYDQEYADTNGITVVPFNQLVREADIITLHLPLYDKTMNIISADVMKSMKKGAVIINTARGGLLDEDAAFELLKSGHLGGLGLDVYDIEPPGSLPIFTLANVVVTPHTGAHTNEAIAAMADLSVKNLIDVLSGRDCPNAVN